MSGGGYDFSAIEKVSSFAQEDALIAGEELKLFFELPDGNKLSSTFKTGQDLAWAKHFVSQETGVDSNDITLIFNDKAVPDILSFADIQGLKNESVVKVQFAN